MPVLRQQPPWDVRSGPAGLAPPQRPPRPSPAGIDRAGRQRRAARSAAGERRAGAL